jgi:hypothetical protein
MSYQEASKKTSHGYEDVIVGAMTYFAAEDWRYTDQSARKVIFRGRPRIPWHVQALMAAGFLALVVPGVALYFLHIRKTYRFSDIVVTATPVRGGTEVVVRYPAPASALAERFVEGLPSA